MIEAANYYDQQRRNLGSEFLAEVEAGLFAIADGPATWPRQFRDVHRYRLHRFPYGVCYRFSQDAITVVAVMHLSRRPGYWKDRFTCDARRQQV